MDPREELARLIERSGLSLRALSARTGVHRNHLREILNGSRPLASLSLEKLHALFAELGHPGRLPLFSLGYPVPAYGPIETDLAHGTTPLPRFFAYLALPLDPPPHALYLAAVTHRTPQPDPPPLPPGFVLLGPLRDGWGPALWVDSRGQVELRAATSLREVPNESDRVPLAQVFGWYPPRSLRLQELSR